MHFYFAILDAVLKYIYLFYSSAPFGLYILYNKNSVTPIVKKRNRAKNIILLINIIIF